MRSASRSRGAGRSTARVAVLAAVLVATIMGCGSASNPAGSGGPGAANPNGSGAVATQPAATNGAGPAAADAAAVASVADVAAAENALAYRVAEAAGIPTVLGPDDWAWANKVLHDELAKAGQNLTITGDAGLTASLDAGPPQAAVDGGGGLAVGMAAAMLGSMANSAEPTVNTNGPQTSTETKTANGETTTVTSTLSIAMSTSGSTIDGDVSIGVDVKVTDVATGSLKKSVSFKSGGKIKLEFCPDANGKVHGHVTITLDGGTSGAGSASISVDADIEGTVGDDAYLNQITVSGQSSQSSTPPGGGPARSSRHSASFTSGINQAGNMTGNVTNATSQVLSGPDDLTQAEADDAVGQIGSAAGAGYWIMGDAAQKKWRGGACVEIRASEHSRDVKKNETVQYQAQVFHKIEGNELHKPIVNTFAGKSSVDPVDIPVPAPVTVSYKAGPKENDTGTVTMTTTSNRGIGTLALTFRVKGGWFIDTPNQGGRLQGQKCGDPPGIWIVEGTYTPKLIYAPGTWIVEGTYKPKLIYAPGTFNGTQKWTVTIDASGTGGTFVYHTDAKGQFSGAPVTVTLKGDARGTATLTIDPISGQAHMVLTETFHEYFSYIGNQVGTDLNAPLEGATFDWEVGGTC